MGAKKTYTCGRCGDEVDPKSARRMGGRYWHFECPRDAFERILEGVLSDMEDE